MKKILFAISSLTLLFAGCKETDTPLDFSHTASTDSIYVLSSVTPQAHNVLIEEFTGQGCPNCPAAHADLEALEAAHPGLVNVISLYSYNQPQAIPPSGSTYNFEDSTALAISTNIYPNASFLPGAGIDRTTFSGNLYLSETQWDADVTSLLVLSDSVNLSVSSSYTMAGDSSTTATITTTVTYLYPVITQQNLNIAIVEDSMVDIQEDNAAPNGYDNAYVFTGVFRAMATNGYSGDPILDTTAKVAGTTERKVYTYVLPKKYPAINPFHCRVIAFVSKGTYPYGPIWQSSQCTLGQ